VITAIVAYTRITIIAIFSPSPTCNELKSFIIDDFKMKKSGPDHTKLSKEGMDNIQNDVVSRPGYSKNVL
jgi:hypothetical protein